MRVAILKYNAGNTASVMNALERLSAEFALTDDPAQLRAADKVVFPGVGEASTAMSHLRERGLDKVIRSLSQPVLGICLGMQLLCSSSEENGTECLNVVANRVRRFGGSGLKFPHIGWNRISTLSSPLFEGVADGSFVYFVHGYFAATGSTTIASCTYGMPFSAAIRRDNFFGVQFHPEKSGPTGEKILENFLRL